MKYILLFSLLVVMSCSSKNNSKKTSTATKKQENLIAVLDTIWRSEQRPITLRDSLMQIYGAESELVKEQQAIYESNHIINEQKVTSNNTLKIEVSHLSNGNYMVVLNSDNNRRTAKFVKY